MRVTTESEVFFMKKHMTAWVSVTLLAALLLTGCGTNATSQNANQAGQQTTTQSTTDTTANGSAAGTAGSAAGTTDTANTADTADGTATDISALTQRVTDAVDNADAAQPSGNRDADRELFFQHTSALDALDREIDAYDDALEAQYARGELTFEEFRKLDRQAEDLEDKLDAAEDRLESRFGMDD